MPVADLQTELTAAPSTEGIFNGNLPAGASRRRCRQPALHQRRHRAVHAKSSLVAYDNLGNEVLLDVYFTKTGADTWQVAVYDQSKATPGPRSPIRAGALGRHNADLRHHHRQARRRERRQTSRSPVPNGGAFTLDLVQDHPTRPPATPFPTRRSTATRRAASTRSRSAQDGTIYAQYENGSFKPLYRIPLADVQSPDRLTSLPGNVYRAEHAIPATSASASPMKAGIGSIVSGALENSNVDIAEELTDMIAAQRSYTANSKVFQTGSDLMDILVNLKR